MNHDDINENNLKDEKDEGLDNVRQNVLCTAFCYARYCRVVEEITGFSMKDFLSAHGWGWNYFSSMRDEEDEPIYTFNDKYMRDFVRRSLKAVRVWAFNQNYDSKNCVDFLNHLSK